MLHDTAFFSLALDQHGKDSQNPSGRGRNLSSTRMNVAESDWFHVEKASGKMRPRKGTKLKPQRWKEVRKAEKLRYKVLLKKSMTNRNNVLKAE